MDAAALCWVEAEVQRCLQRARGGLEAYADSGVAAGHLSDCLEAVHVARGALVLVECDAPAMLLEEVEAVLGGLAQAPPGGGGRAVDATLCALFKSADYLHWLARGNAPAPLVLLPLFNDLKAARGASLVSEGTLFAPDLAPRLRLPRNRRSLALPALHKLARSLRGQLQRGLLEWYRGSGDAAAGLRRIGRTLATLEQVAGPERLWPVWWVAGGVVAALREGRLEDGPAARRVIGQLDVCVRALTDDSVAPERLAPPRNLLKNLLFLATRVVEPAGRRVEAVRAAYALQPYVPGGDERQRAERSFAGPGPQTLQALASALRAESRELQAALDARARGLAASEQDETLAGALRRFGDCFGMLDRGAERRALHAAAERLCGTRGGDASPALGSAAEALLGAVDALDLVLQTGVEPATERSEQERLQQSVVEAVVVELFTSLAGLKQLLLTPDSALPAGELQRHLEPCEGALRMIGRQPAARLLGQWREAAGRLLQGRGGAPPRASLELLAECLLALERHLAADIGREPAREAALSGVERRMRRLLEVARAAPRRPAEVTGERAGPVSDNSAEHAGEPDVLAVFLAECGERVEEIRQHAVAWTDDPRDREALREMRRAFHTLRGGGRLMGAGNLADLAVAVERMLGRVMEGTLAPGPALHEALGEACQLLPRTIVAPGSGGEPAPVTELVARLERLHADGDTATKAARPAEETAGEPPLTRVFVDEAGEILDACDALMQKLKSDPEDAGLLNELRRELHTLKGGAHLAGFAELGDLSHAMESALAPMADGQAVFSLSFLALMEESFDRFADQLDLLRAERRPVAQDELVHRIESFVSGRGVTAHREAAPRLPAALSPRGRGADRDDRIQVPIGLLDRLTGLAGELGVTQSHIAEGLSRLRASLAEMREAVRRVRTQARRLERDTRPAPVLADDDRVPPAGAAAGERAASLRGLARAIAESADDLQSLWQSLESYAELTGGTVAQQSRAGTDLHNELTRARREPFGAHAPRLRRIVRRTLQDMGKQGELAVAGESVEVDRLLMDRLLPALEHMLRNAVAHGIETPAERRARGKSEQGAITIGLERGSGELELHISDDGRGLQRASIHHAAVSRGLLPPDAPFDDPALDEMILRPGFSTATELTRFSGHGLGMDVASSLVRQLGGDLTVASEPGRGTCFTMRLPLEATLKQVLLVAVDDGVHALLTSSVAGVLERDALAAAVLPAAPADEVEHEGLRYRCIRLGRLLGSTRRDPRAADAGPAVLVRAGEERFALLVDGIIGRQEIVLSALGPAPAGSQHAVGATILADGRAANVLDVAALVRAAADERGAPAGKPARRRAPLVLVADDSITVRQVTSRLLGREGMEVMTAKDGIEALALLREHTPDALVLDIEMPRMDGFQVASAVRGDTRLQHLPIVMVTSRVGPKHSERARSLGVDHYLGKPYVEQELVGHIRALLAAGAGAAARVSTGT